MPNTTPGVAVAFTFVQTYPTPAVTGGIAPVYMPGVNGIPLPANCTRYLMEWDQVNIPGQSGLEFVVEYQRNQWTDRQGVVHANGEWLPDVGHAAGNLAGGTWTPVSTGTPTTINLFGSSIGARDGNGAMVEPYPVAMRLKVNQAGSWVMPVIRITFTISVQATLSASVTLTNTHSP